MPKTNYHCHCSYSDGRTGIAALVEGAIAKGFDALGISTHAPLPFPTEWNMDASAAPAYLADIAAARAAHAGRIEVYAGLEIDWLPGEQSPADEKWKAYALDYSIGSVHFVREGGGLFSVDGPQEELDSNVAARLGGDWVALYRAFWAEVRAMIERGGFDILAHFDVVMKNNPGAARFDPASADYLAEAERTLDLAAERGIIVEINSGGIARKRSPQLFPHERFLEGMRKRGIPVCVNSDAHAPDQLDGAFDIAYAALARAGYEETRMLLGGEWKAVPLGESGKSGR